MIRMWSKIFHFLNEHKSLLLNDLSNFFFFFANCFSYWLLSFKMAVCKFLHWIWTFSLGNISYWNISINFKLCIYSISSQFHVSNNLIFVLYERRKASFYLAYVPELLQIWKNLLLIYSRFHISARSYHL